MSKRKQKHKHNIVSYKKLNNSIWNKYKNDKSYRHENLRILTSEVNIKFGIIGSDILRQSFFNPVDSSFHCKYIVRNKSPFSDSKDSLGIKRLLHSVV